MSERASFVSVLDWLHDGLPPELVWGLVPRFVGALFAIAFASIAPQLPALVGSRGIAPVREQLAAARRHFPGWQRFVRFPSLFWLDRTDLTVRLLPWAAALAGLYGAAGGPGSWWALLFCWMAWLSLDCAWLTPPWDSMMMEVGLLSLFVPAPLAFTQLAAAELPLPIVAFAWRLLLIRLMWGFAKTKFVGTKPGDSLYFRGFFAWLPINTPLGLWLQQAPASVLRAGYWFMWFAEVVCPGLALFTGAPRAIAGLGFIGVMLGIFLTGNWGLFNVSFSLLSIILFDTRSSIVDTTLPLILSSPGVLAVHVVMAVLLLGALLYFPLNSLISHTALQWPLREIRRRVPVLGALISFYRALLPFRVLHAYGVFPPNSLPPVKLTLGFEGSHDGQTYRSYEYRYLPSTDASRPRFVAPHMPRLDHLAGFVGIATEGDYLSGLFGAGKVIGFTPFSRYAWIPRVAQRLLEGEPSVLALFGHNPFPERPPRFVRASLRGLIPRSIAERRRTGLYWETRHLGLVLAPRQSSELVYRHWLPPPELSHPDFVHWKHKSFALRAMLSSYQAGAPHEEAVRLHSDIHPDEVASFWREFVPQVAHARGDFATIDETAAAVLARFGEEGIVRLERIAERYAHLLRTRLEPHLDGAQTPTRLKRSNFRFHLLLHEIILDGQAAYGAALREPDKAIARASSQTDASALHFLGVVRNETIRYQGLTLRVLQRLGNVAERDDLPGILQFRALLRDHVSPHQIDLPFFEQTATGDWKSGATIPAATA